MKDAAPYQMEAVTSTTISLQQGFKKSIKSYKKEVGHFAKSLAGFVDGEDICKSIHQAARPDNYNDLQTKVLHTPIDWSKRSPSSHKLFSYKYSLKVGENENGDVQKNVDSDSVLKITEIIQLPQMTQIDKWGGKPKNHLQEGRKSQRASLRSAKSVDNTTSRYFK